MIARRVALLLLAALAACQTTPRVAPPGSTPEVRQALGSLSEWRARGRVAVRAPNEGFSASFDWREAAGRGQIDVRGPLGAGAARISRAPDLIRIETGSNPPIDIPAPFDTLESELAARLGFPLPIEPLRYWLLGVPDPGLPSDAAADGFRQAGWTVALAEFAPVTGAPAPLPSRLVLSRPGTQIKVLVSTWQVGTP